MGTGQCKEKVVTLPEAALLTPYCRTMASTEEEVVAASSDTDDVSNRVYWTLEDKVSLCIEADKVVNAEKRMSFRGFVCVKSEEHGLPLQPSQLRRWMKNISSMKAALEHTTKKKTKVTCNMGRKSRLWKWKDKLIPWIEQMMKDGQKMTVRRVAVRARRYETSLRRMKRYTQFAIVRRFLKSTDTVIRAVTHQAQEDPREKEDTAMKFLETTRALLQQTNRDKAFIINMDQTPYNPKDGGKYTLAKKGSRTVTLRQMNTSVG